MGCTMCRRKESCPAPGNGYTLRLERFAEKRFTLRDPSKDHLVRDRSTNSSPLSTWEAALTSCFRVRYRTNCCRPIAFSPDGQNPERGVAPWRSKFEPGRQNRGNAGSCRTEIMSGTCARWMRLTFRVHSVRLRSCSSPRRPCGAWGLSAQLAAAERRCALAPCEVTQRRALGNGVLKRGRQSLEWRHRLLDECLGGLPIDDEQKRQADQALTAYRSYLDAHTVADWRNDRGNAATRKIVVRDGSVRRVKHHAQRQRDLLRPVRSRE